MKDADKAEYIEDCETCLWSVAPMDSERCGCGRCSSVVHLGVSLSAAAGTCTACVVAATERLVAPAASEHGG